MKSFPCHRLRNPRQGLRKKLFREVLFHGKLTRCFSKRLCRESPRLINYYDTYLL